MQLTLAELATRTGLIEGVHYFRIGDRAYPIVRGGDGSDDDPKDDAKSDPTEDPKPESKDDDPGRLPDDHPLVKAYQATKTKLADTQSKRAAEKAELDTLRKEKLPPEEQVLEEAREAGRKEATASAGQKLAKAEIKAALTGIVDDPAGIIEDLDLAKFVDEDGEVRDDKVAALKKKYADLLPEDGVKKKFPDLGQGKRPTGTAATVGSGKDLFEDRRKKK